MNCERFHCKLWERFCHGHVKKHAQVLVRLLKDQLLSSGLAEEKSNVYIFKLLFVVRETLQISRPAFWTIPCQLDSRNLTAFYFFEVSRDST